jgi:hypothetical protein
LKLAFELAGPIHNHIHTDPVRLRSVL